MYLFKLIQSLRQKGFLQTIRLVYIRFVPLRITWILYDSYFLSFLRRLSFQIYYKEYLSRVQLSRLEETISCSSRWEKSPKIEWFLIVHQSCCLDAVKSILNQRYQQWKLKIIFECQTQKLPDRVTRDSRLSILQKKDNQSLASLCNQLIKKSSSDWVGFSSSDDVLAPSFFYEIANTIHQNPQISAIYSDHQTQFTTSQRTSSFPKTQFSYWTLLSHQYIGSVFAIKRQVILDASCFKTKSTSPFYDLLLRLNKNLTHQQIVCLQFPLWTRLLRGQKRSAFWGEYPHGKVALTEYWKNEKTEVALSQNYLFTTHQFQIKNQPLVSIIIPFKDHWNLTEKAIHSVLNQSSYSHFEILLVDNQSSIETKQKVQKYLTNHHQIKLLNYDEIFNFSAINNFAVQQAKGEYLVLLNNDVEVLSKNWLEKMLGYAQHQQIGAVGAKLYYPDFSIQHAGIALGLFSCAGHPLRFLKNQDDEYFSLMLHASREVSAVTAACLMVKKSIYQQVGGLDSQFAVAFNDVDFCLKLRQAGYTNLVLNDVELLHNESSSRGDDETPEKQHRIQSEISLLQSKWQDLLENDPFYSPRLTKDAEDCLLVFP